MTPKEQQTLWVRMEPTFHGMMLDGVSEYKETFLHRLMIVLEDIEKANPMDSAPRDGTTVLLMWRGIAYSGSYRRGRHGEPQPDEIGWRADCCGRWCNPDSWMPLDQLKARKV